MPQQHEEGAVSQVNEDREGRVLQFSALIGIRQKEGAASF
jgi:hypothetical protein